MDGRIDVLRGIVIAGAILTAACACERDRAVDDMDGGVLDFVVAVPVAPATVTLACPEGWRARTVASGASVCEPWPSDGPTTCAPDEAAIPGRGCVTIGEACPEDGWPAELPASGVTYVRAGATAGDGTREHPYGTLAEAAGVEGVIALAVGEHEGSIDTRAERIVGACASRTIVRDARTEGDATIMVRASDGEIRDVTVVSAAIPAVRFGEGVHFEVRRVVLESPIYAARVDPRASVEMEDVILREPEGTVVATLAARLSTGSSITLRRASVRGSIWLGDEAEEGSSTVVLEEVAFQDASFAVLGAFGTLEARRVVIERVELGFGVSPWTSATLEDVVIRELHSVPSSGDDPSAIFSSGDVTADRLWIADVEGPAIAISSAERIVRLGEPASLELADVVIEDVIAAEAVGAQDGTIATIDRIHVARVHGDAIAAADPGTSLTLRDATISDVTTVGIDGDAIGILLGAAATIERVAVRGTARGALLIAGPGTHVGASDLDVDAHAAGVVVQCAIAPTETCETGAEPMLTLRRSRIVGAHGFGIGADQAQLTLEDVRVDGVSARGPLDGFGIVEVSARIEGARVEVVGATRHAVLAFGAATALEVTGLRVTDTRPSPPCEGEGCAREALGDAVTCAEGASLTLRGFVAERAASAGVMLVQGCASATFERGRIVDNALGVLTDATVPRPRFVNVVVDDNGTDFGTTTLTVARPTF
ncbi:hypothetical protein [Sandaracinus amylolyticus]|uniref:hypothetical protein n=1 Tax=Sandaracinus amylolyticus TaxID=927083 RepID=UPI0012EDA35B|nr:hypothetical protein [Sandaracinus amylolyticus]